MLLAGFVVSSCRWRAPTSSAVTASASDGIEHTDLHRLFNDGSIPLTFKALVERCETLGHTQKVLIPVGRSVQRDKGKPDPLSDPRRVVACSLSKNSMAPYSLFLGYVRGANQIEAISYNRATGLYDFLLINDFYNDAKTAVVPTLNPAVRGQCMSCHQHGGPIFMKQGWSETNANKLIEQVLQERIKGSEIDGIPLAQPHGDGDYPFGLTSQEFEATVLSATELLRDSLIWRDICGGTDAVSCRAKILRFAFHKYLSIYADAEPVFAHYKDALNGVQLAEHLIADRPMPDNVQAVRLFLLSPAAFNVPADLDPRISRAKTSLLPNDIDLFSGRIIKDWNSNIAKEIIAKNRLNSSTASQPTLRVNTNITCTNVDGRCNADLMFRREWSEQMPLVDSMRFNVPVQCWIVSGQSVECVGNGALATNKHDRPGTAQDFGAFRFVVNNDVKHSTLQWTQASSNELLKLECLWNNPKLADNLLGAKMRWQCQDFTVAPIDAAIQRLVKDAAKDPNHALQRSVADPVLLANLTLTGMNMTSRMTGNMQPQIDSPPSADPLPQYQDPTLRLLTEYCGSCHASTREQSADSERQGNIFLGGAGDSKGCSQVLPFKEKIIAYVAPSRDPKQQPYMPQISSPEAARITDITRKAIVDGLGSHGWCR